ncbi:Tyrosine recombinase XerC [Rubrobacter xylanophilus DSM 9941]|uniref:Site-specific integrase n=1 Tax=Rubrobacter xylanophilus TaxID=49319 RepID=A0A510HKF9_9ACTN|nr:site-specific integrase [Rubrobacter xylanophilus]QYJ14865.1 Tyrosine recombinase XerC [Rubrobacter xylanophilus DSM 9941]BBL79083.1 site-specific integrase [Rubrobacter xylanophilus]
MGKRGNGEGSISRRKNGTWRAEYTVYTAEGRKRNTLYGKTRREVAEKLAKAIADRNGGIVYDAGKLTVGEYLDRWLSDSVRDTVRQRTYERYESIVRVHIKPTLGRIKLKTLAPAHVRGLYREKLGAGLSPRTVQYIHVTLHKALKQAVRDELIPRNASEAIKAPRPTKKEIRPLSPDQARAFLDAARGDRFETLYVLAVHCGLREGELLGLKWEDVDLDAGTLAVRRTLSETRTGHRFEAPKNGKGRRIKLTTGAMKALRRHRKAQLEERLRAAGLWEDHGLVFPNQVGKTMNAKNLTARSFKQILERAGLPRTVRVHDLRHTCATILLKVGQHPKYVQELLGHANIGITLDTYSHVLPGMGDGLADAMDDALG